MGRPRSPEPVKLLIGLLSGDADLLRRARQLLARRFGPVDLESELWPFTQTDYYREEMGADLRRLFISFERLIQPDQLADIKHEANALEDQIADELLDPEISRPVNIDPGYIDLGKLVLATTKDRSHRIYIGAKIYAEVTLQYAQERWQPGAWTYADYLQPCYHEFFSRVRARLYEQRRAAESRDWSAEQP